MKRLAVILILLFVACGLRAATLYDLVTQLRATVGEEDSTWSAFSDTTAKKWLNLAQDKINRLGGYIEKTWDHTYATADTFGVVLPSDFKAPKSAIIWVGNQWETMVPNKAFRYDTAAYQFDVQWKNKDTARVYFKGSDLYAGLQIRLTYLGNAADLTDSATVCEVSSDLQVFVIEEAISYYLKAQRQYQAAFMLEQQIRHDMGIQPQKANR